LFLSEMKKATANGWLELIEIGTYEKLLATSCWLLAKGG